MKQNLLVILVVLLITIFAGSLSVVYYTRKKAVEATPTDITQNKQTVENRIVGLIKTIASKYSETDPLIISADKDTDSTTSPVYTIIVRGNFVKDEKKADSMILTLKEDENVVRGLKAYNEVDPDSTLWQDDVVTIQ